ncbi:MAG: hypothetical protein ACU0GG_13470 [Paracoccaceae bacterium]
MTADLLALIALHFACADITAERQPSSSEMAQCSVIYEEIKLAFVPGVSAKNYAGLSQKEQTAVSLAGYVAFSDWRDQNVDMVAHLERVARGEEDLRAPKDL